MTNQLDPKVIRNLLRYVKGTGHSTRYWIPNSWALEEFESGQSWVHLNEGGWVTKLSLNHYCDDLTELTGEIYNDQRYFDELILEITDPRDRPKCANEDDPELGIHYLPWSGRINCGYGSGRSLLDDYQPIHRCCCKSCSVMYMNNHPDEYEDWCKGRESFLQNGGGFGLIFNDPNYQESYKEWYDNHKEYWESGGTYGNDYGGRIPFESLRYNKIIWCRSKFEYQCLEYIDTDPETDRYEYESIHIKYTHPDGYVRNYIPDFLVYYTDGSIHLAEAKYTTEIDDPVNQAKFAAAQDYCNERGWKFVIWTENDI